MTRRESTEKAIRHDKKTLPAGKGRKTKRSLSLTKTEGVHSRKSSQRISRDQKFSSVLSDIGYRRCNYHFGRLGLADVSVKADVHHIRVRYVLLRVLLYFISIQWISLSGKCRIIGPWSISQRGNFHRPCIFFTLPARLFTFREVTWSPCRPLG